MSFLKSIRRGVRGIVKHADHGLAKLGSGISTGGKFVKQVHNLYRDGKHELLKRVPELEGAIRFIERSPAGVTVKSARESLENLAGDANFVLKRARDVTQERGRQMDAQMARAQATFNEERERARPAYDAVSDFIYGRNQDYAAGPQPSTGKWIQ